MKTKLTKTLSIIAIAALFAACKKDKENGTSTTRGEYILTVTPIASTAVADYLVNVPTLESGSVSTLGNGQEQDGTYRYYITHKGKFFSMLYGQGNPGAVTVYNNVDGKLNKLTNFQSETVQAFAGVNDDILMTKIPRSKNPAGTLINYYQISTNTLQITKEGTLNSEILSNNGEIAHFTWIQQVGNKVFAPFFGLNGDKGGFLTSYPNQAWIAVYSYPDMTLEKVIQDNRTSFIGRYFVNGLGVVENGDTYAFSSSVAQSLVPAVINGKDSTKVAFTSTKPSAITRIKSGTTEFDTYFLNFEEKLSGYAITNWIYIGSNKFVAHVLPVAEKGPYTAGKELAIVDVVNQTVTKVTGLPNKSEIKSLTANNYTSKDGKTAYVGVNLTSGLGYIYKIDATNATATQGLKVEGGTITAVQYLSNN